MRLLKLGVKGEDVTRWEIFLRGINPKSNLVVDGDFNEVTSEETKKFQKSVGLKIVDGIVGMQTYAEAMKRGFNPGILDDRVDDGPNWPPKPTNLPQLNYLDRTNVFGQFAFIPAPTATNPEGIKITDDWVSKNVTKIIIPQLIGVKGAARDGGIFIHSKIVNQTIKMFQTWEDNNLHKLILTWGGSWVPRFIRGSRTTLSNHSWGTAFDINVAWNGLGVEPALRGQKGSVRELVHIANEYGYFWGGHFNSRPDGMHFEVAKVII